MVEIKKTPDAENPELGLNPNSSNASNSVPTGSVTTDAIKNDLDELISATVGKPGKEVDFTTSVTETIDAQASKKKAHEKSKKIPIYIGVFALFVALFLSAGALLFLFYQYILYQKTGVVAATWSEYMPWTQQKYEYVVRTLGLQQLDKYSPQQVITTNTRKNNIISNIIEDTDIDFLTKKKVLQEGVQLLYRDIGNRYDKYEDLKNVIGQQGFYPTSVQDMAKGLNFEGSLQRAIVTMESVRFVVALKYFSLLDTFITQVSSRASMSKEDVKAKMDMFVSRGEKDINNYITSCYLNGYEPSITCGTIGDFFNYYNYVDQSLTDQDKRLFLIVMDAIEAKLENTKFPSLDISVDNINTSTNTIALKVDVNTLPEDEAKLTLDSGILNPHIYLITSVINYLRESRYVITESIKLNTLNIDKKTVKIGGQTITVNSSSYNFELPLQNEVVREIYDFTDEGLLQ